MVIVWAEEEREEIVLAIDFPLLHLLDLVMEVFSDKVAEIREESR